MKLSIKAADLLKILEQAGTTIGKKDDLPFSWMYLEAKGEKENQKLLAYATDMTSRTLIKAPATITKPGKVFIHHGLLASLLATVPKTSDVDLWLTGKDTLVFHYKCSGGKGVLPMENTTQDTDKILDALPLKGSPIMEMSAKTLSELVSRTEFATTTTRQPILAAIHIKADENGYWAETCDGNMAATAYIKDERAKDSKGKEIIVPKTGFAHLMGMLGGHKDEEGKVVYDVVKVIPGREQGEKSNNMYFRLTDAFYGTNLIDGAYPSLTTILSEAEKVRGKSFKVSTEELKKTISRASLFSEEGHVHLVMKDNKLTVSTSGKNKGDFSSSIDGADTEQKIDAEVLLNLYYLDPVLRNTHGENLTITVTTNGSKVWMADTEDKDNQSTYLVGCVQLPKEKDESPNSD